MGDAHTSTQCDSVISIVAYLCSHGFASTFTSLNLRIGHAVTQSTSNRGVGTDMVIFRNNYAQYQANQVAACLLFYLAFTGVRIAHNGIGHQGATL